LPPPRKNTSYWVGGKNERIRKKGEEKGKRKKGKGKRREN